MNIAHAFKPPLSSRKLLNRILVTGIATFILISFLAPLGYMFTTALKSTEQMSDPGVPPWWPFSRVTFAYQGQDLEIYQVPMDGETRNLALLKKTRKESWFIDPQDPTAEPILWEGNWRTLSPAYKSDPRWQNFKKAWDDLNFPRLFMNSMIIASFGTVGAVLSSISVAYGFSRFKFRGRNLLFLILIGTIILPVQVTLIPTYILFSKIGWTNTFLPLIVPHFFANAYNVFLLRQYFMQIPNEMDEAAMIDGANPLQVLTQVILPQSIPALTAVSLFHFFFAWNDFFSPLIYLASKPELWPLSVGLQKFNALYGRMPNLIQTGALITLVLPVVIFFLAQRVFMQGIVFTGVEK
ncbi:MAG: carbohydrate ABC transporter permease [Anaerolineaceae bacterium]|nr:carbohydrate ABC transporter permease [Anaerolineaceae bacterium]MBN2677268.1 carbohydrate ABC transporter permease [Anaerolineaceae bacterium]